MVSGLGLQGKFSACSGDLTSSHPYMTEREKVAIRCAPILLPYKELVLEVGK